MLLIIPTIQKIVSPAATGPVKRKSGPNGFAMKSMEIPRATATPASAIWPISWYRARRSNRSSIAPRPAATAPPSSRAATSDVSRLNGIGTRSAAWLTSRNSAGDQEERGADGQAAAPRDRDGVDPPRLRPVDDLVAEHDPSDDRRHREGDQRGEDEHDHDRSDEVPDVRDERHPGRIPLAGGAIVGSVTPPAGPGPGIGRRSRGPRRRGAPARPARRGGGWRR